jgi:hypothetical protein
MIIDGRAIPLFNDRRNSIALPDWRRVRRSKTVLQWFASRNTPTETDAYRMELENLPGSGFANGKA